MLPKSMIFCLYLCIILEVFSQCLVSLQMKIKFNLYVTKYIKHKTKNLSKIPLFHICHAQVTSILQLHDNLWFDEENLSQFLKKIKKLNNKNKISLY